MAAVAVLIDEPIWWYRGRRWSHLVSDVSYDELHTFAEQAGIRRGFRGTITTFPRNISTT